MAPPRYLEGGTRRRPRRFHRFREWLAWTVGSVLAWAVIAGQTNDSALGNDLYWGAWAVVIVWSAHRRRRTKAGS